MTHREGELDDPKHRVILRHFTFRIFQFQFFNLFYIAGYLGSARLVIDAVRMTGDARRKFYIAGRSHEQATSIYRVFQ